jgi:hypothetical protein
VTAVAAHCPLTSLADDLAAVCRAIGQRDGPVSPQGTHLGSALGPGFATINPYAGFWLLPLVAASEDSIRAGIAVAAALGGIHAIGRTLVLMRDIRREEAAQHDEDPDYGQAILNYKVAMVKMAQFRAWTDT